MPPEAAFFYPLSEFFGLAWSEGQTQQAEALQDDAEEARRLRGERWWRGHPLGPKLMNRIVLNAYWPHNGRAQADEVMAEAKKGAQSLEREHMKNFAGLVLERLRKTDTIREEITRMRQGLARRTQNAEIRLKAMLDEEQKTIAESAQADHTKDVMNRFEWER